MTDYFQKLTELEKYYSGVDLNYISDSLSLFSKENTAKKKYAFKIFSFLDLTTLEGNDTSTKVKNLCEKAIKPFPLHPEIKCAAVCIYPKFIKTVRGFLKNSGVRVASVATAFPAGQVPLNLKLKEVEFCINEGAEEIDMVISRGEFLEGNYDYVYNEIKEVNKICKENASSPARLKVILETGELISPQFIHLASHIAIEAGADFIKTSTGKINTSATIPASYVMLKVIKEYFDNTGRKIGFKPAGGIKKTEDALKYITLVENILGKDWLSPELFRIGASSLLDDLVKFITEENICQRP